MPKASWWMAFMDIQNVSNHSPFIYKPTQKIKHKYQNITLMNNNC